MKRVLPSIAISVFLISFYASGAAAFSIQLVEEVRQAADQGEAEAQTRLGVIYARGIGLPKDKLEAVKWFRLAAGQGNPEAQWNLGLCYIRGDGVPQDFYLAAE